MLQEETLNRTGRREYEEPEGEFLEMMSSGSNTITVLTRVEQPEVPAVSAPVDPDTLTVMELKEALGDSAESWSQEQLQALLEAEQDGKDRTTATDAIKERFK